MPKPKFLDDWQSHWNLIVQVGTWVLAIVAQFVIPPPFGGDAQGAGAWTPFARFVAMIVIGLMILLAMRLNKKPHTVIWASLTVVLLVAVIAAWLSYTKLTDRWSATYNGRLVLIGSELTEQGKKNVAKNPDISKDDLLFDFAGKVDDVWTEESIEQNRFWLGILYLALVPLAACCIVAISQAIHCATREA